MTEDAAPPMPLPASDGSTDWRVGEWAEVRPLSQIARTLDAEGALDGMPFMREMIPHVGRRFRVVKIAHKTCDASGWDYARTMSDAVHLETRCSGAHHGGCEAACRFFWKTAWLKKVDGPFAEGAEPLAVSESPRETGHLEARLAAAAHRDVGDVVHWRCQATEIKNASRRLKPWHLKQYWLDLRNGNITVPQLFFYVVKALLRTGKARYNDLRFALSRLAARPAERKRSVDAPPLDLRPGELVRVRSKTEILATLDGDRKNFGLPFDADMAQFCGTTQRVMGRVHRIVDERDGHMLEFKRACIALQNVTCTGLNCPTRLFCPREMFTYWREGWLERMEEPLDPRSHRFDGPPSASEHGTPEDRVAATEANRA